MEMGRISKIWHHAGRKARLSLLAAVIAAAALPGYQVRAAEDAGAQAAGTADSGTSANGERMQQVLDLLNQYHVQAPSAESLEQAAIQGMVESLHDPYTVYMSAKEWKQFSNSLERSYVGIGIQMAQDEKGIYIDKVFPGSPAEAAGLQANDYIKAVEDKSTSGKTMDMIGGWILGDENTQVTVTFSRSGSEFKKTLTRKAISLPVMDSAKFPGDIGYLKLYTFSSDADEQFAAKLKEWQSQGSGLQSLIIDLRGNPGGLVETARNIASNFIQDGVLVHTSDRNGKDDPVVIKNGSAVSYPVIMLVNENSASASEVLTGALQDYGIATVVGTQTFGKGCIQSIVSFPDGAKLKLTVVDYFTPKGYPVNHVGITPNVKEQGGLTQLLDALRLAGLKQMTITKDRSAVSINGIRVSDALPMMESKGKIFVHARVLAAMAGADVAWNSKTMTASLAVKETAEKASFSTHSNGIQFVDGKMYIELGIFAKTFKEFSYSGSSSKLTLAVQKKGS